MGGVESEVWEWRKTIVDLHKSVRVAFVIVYGTMHVIYYLTKHEIWQSQYGR